MQRYSMKKHSWKPVYFYRTQVNPIEPYWTLLNPIEPNWTQLNYWGDFPFLKEFGDVVLHFFGGKVTNHRLSKAVQL